MQIDESYPEHIDPKSVGLFLAEKKNDAYRDQLDDQVIITADTTVICRGRLLGKPADELSAARMLESLSGEVHSVITGVCLSDIDRKVSFQDETVVKFRHLTSYEIDYYIKAYKPFDKAGAYGIQEWIGLIGVERIEGSYFNVMGLPAHRVYDALVNEFGITLEGAV